MSDLIHFYSDITTSSLAFWLVPAGAALAAGVAWVRKALPLVFGGTHLRPPITCPEGLPASAHIAQCGSAFPQLAAL